MHREGLGLSEEPEGSGAGWAGDGVRPAGAVPRPDPWRLVAPPDTVAVGQGTSVRPSLPEYQDPARSPDPAVCPFLRRDLGGRLLAPASVSGAEQICAATGEPRAQSLRQQELVCLRAAHVDCPRYERGAAAFAARASSRSLPSVPRATLAALVILVLSAALSFGFVVQRGGISMPVVPPDATAAAVVATGAPTAGLTEPPAATAAPTEPPAATVAPTPAPSPSPSTAPTPTPTPVAIATPKPTARPTPKPTPRPASTPKSDRYRLLDPCPDRKRCWIYVVRAGDNLFSIANYFGHSLSTIYEWNPQYPGTRLRAGAAIRMPPPTR